MHDDSLDDIREKVFSEYPFALSNEEKDILGELNTKSIPQVVGDCRQKIEHLGRRCAVFAFLKNDSDGNKVSDADYEFDSLLKEYAIIRNSSSNIWELMGFVSLLEMDAIFLLIGILTAEGNVERKMLSKHAYTIVFEARQNGLFQKVSKEMTAFPESLLPKKENDELWSMSGLKVEHTIRNHIDAHISSSFECQYETFHSCNWGQAVYDLLVLIQISDRMLGVIESVFTKYKYEIEVATDRIRTRVSRLVAILEKLRQE